MVARFAPLPVNGHAAPVETPQPEPVPDPFLRMTPRHRLVVIGVYAAFVVAAGTLSLVTGAPGAEWYVPALALLMATRVVPLLAYDASYGWFHPLILTGLLSLRPLLQEFPQYAAGLAEHPALPTLSPDQLGRLLAWKLVLQALSVVAYYVGFFYGFRIPRPRLAFGPGRALGAKTAAAVVLSVAVFEFYVSRRGGVTAYMLLWAQGRSTALAGNYYWVQLIGLGLLACLIWFTQDRRALRRPVFWVAVAASMAVAFLATGSRSMVFYAVIVGFMVWVLRERKVAWGRFLLLGAGGLVALGALGALRKSTFTGHVDWGTITDFSAGETLMGSSLPELVERRTTLDSTLPILAKVPEEHEFLYGSTYAAVLALPIPRSIWTGKPGLSGGRIGREFFHTRAGIPVTGVGEAYWNFHVPGVLLVFALFGVFHRWVASLFVPYARWPGMMLLYALGMWSMHDPSSDGVVAALFAIVPCVILCRVFGVLQGGGPPRKASRSAALQPMFSR
jgi:hypothetical protein